MKTLSVPLLLALLLCLAACSKKREGQPRVLVFSKTAGFRHESIGAGIKAIQKLGQENGFTVDTTEDAGKFVEDTLSKYAAVIFLNTTGDVLDNYQEADFERYIQAGGGYVGIHAATDTEYDWGWYNKLAGAYFDSHPPGVHQANVNVVDNDFIATKGLPNPWKRTDEWYNYKKRDTTVHVLLTLDEKSYEGGNMNGNHPISWYHDYDGGRAFYTGLGHTVESYSEENFLKHILGGIKYAIGKNLYLDYSKATTLRVPSEDRFTKQTLTSGEFTEPTEMTILPNLDILVAQRRGELMLYNNTTKQLTQVGKLDVYYKTDIPNINAEEGFLGLTADPNFAKNNYLYIFYSPVDTSVNRLSRFVFKDGKLDMKSEKVILQFYSQRYICCHTGGSLAFGPDGLLYISTGDNSTPFDEPNQPYKTSSFAPLDDRPGHTQYDGRRSSGNTNDLRGKILRIRVNEDGSYDIPKGNLFEKSDKTRPEIFVMGTRNPYRISVDQKTGFLYWGEVGPDANNDSLETRGPRGYDEVNQAKKAGNYGYPLFIANNIPYVEYDYATGVSGKKFDPAKPINKSRNNTGLQELPPAQPAFIWYPYAKSTEFPIVGSGGRNAEAGPVFYEEFYPKETRFPKYYEGKLFIYDWIRGWIMAVTMDKDGNFSKMERFMPNTRFNAPIDMEMGPDGRLYVLEYGNGWFSKNPDAGLARIDFNGGNRAPKASINVDKLTGSLPFKVKITAEASDPDKDKLTYIWYFGNGMKKETTENSVEYTYTQPGEYPVAVEVYDPNGAHVRSNSINVYAGNETPQVAIKLNGNTQFYFPGKAVSYTVAVTDKEDGSLANGTLDVANLFVKTEYVEGRDKAAMPQGHQIVTAATMGKNIMETLDCKTCHKTNETSIGPAFMLVADKYKGDPKASDYLVNKIIKGGGGVWGETAMSAHPNLSVGDAKMIVDYIFSLKADPASKIASLPATGSVVPATAATFKDKGIFYLLASYTDKGGSGIKPLTGSAIAELVSPSLSAYDFTVGDGVSKMEYNGMRLALPSANSFMTFAKLDLNSVNGIELQYAGQKPLEHGLRVQAYLGTQLLGETVIGQNLEPMKPSFATINFATVNGVTPQDLKLVFTPASPGEAGTLGIIFIKLLSR
ncbi:glucose/arabinose dehydrogenase [Chitinophaga skermanii]|uniref:Glucose/arabinose dehydrogenase n=1 Tax=Chitinophaga skermanii TaxID=331697 RepID=A0A327R1I5_9BACT|nr:ThuA domain-containing protein [Chitinophaga skermanii]RAJ10736.1 glucose/arabinose dehydrogenase [Chitinophaga skermanii]